jgi:hypothetical protein
MQKYTVIYLQKVKMKCKHGNFFDRRYRAYGYKQCCGSDMI